jgi:cytochrome c551/c552
MEISSIAGQRLPVKFKLRAGMIWLLCVFVFCARAEEPKAGTFWEPDFSYLEAIVDARTVPNLTLTNNLTVRGIVLSLGNHTFACFDTDLLRLAYVWHGDGLQFASMAPISYVNLGKKNDIGQAILNRPVGDAFSALGFYPGVANGKLTFKDPRAAGLDPGELGRGPIDASIGRWEGIYTVGDKAVLHYTVGGTSVHEFLTAIGDSPSGGYTRNFQIAPHSQSIQIALADYSEPYDRFRVIEGSFGPNVTGGDTFLQGFQIYDRPDTESAATEKSAAGVVVNTVPRGGGTVFILTISPNTTEQKICVEFSKKAQSNEKFSMPDFAKGGSARWPETVVTHGVIAGDTNAYVIDRLTLPTENPWHRLVRPSSLCFYPDGRAAVVTFDGDVWQVSGITKDLSTLTWRRIASGLHEPQSIHYREGNLYVFTRNGIVCLRDLNGDGEIDYYENFANCFAQSAETRDFAMDSIVAKDGGIYIAEGGQQGQFMGIHNASVLKVAPDGRSAEVVARGLRGPYLGYNRGLDLLTTSDQQGNWIPTSPILWLRPGKFYGFLPSTKIQPPKQSVTEPVCWIPYRSAQSTSGQVWASGDKLGALDGRLIQLDYFHPRLLVAFFDSNSQPVQGAVSELDVPVDFPLLKGELGPNDGDLYLAGFRIWGSDAKEWAGIGRLRYTGKPGSQPAYARSAKDGLLVQFAEPLDSISATNLGNFTLERWNYRRTSAYGSGHYKLDNTAGQEFMPIRGALISADRKSIFLYVPEMKKVNQMDLTYRLAHEKGGAFDGHVYFTVQELEDLDLKHYDFPEVDWMHWNIAQEIPQGKAQEVISAAEGQHCYQAMGCVACHSIDGVTVGRVGPTFLGLFGKECKFASGAPEVADEAYIRESILKPQAKIVDGYQKSEVLMPSYEGVLTDAQIQSIILYIKSLSMREAK